MRSILLISFFLALGHGELSAFNTDNQTGSYIFVYDAGRNYFENVAPGVSHGWPNPPKDCITLYVCASYEGYNDCAINSTPRSCNIQAGGQQVVSLDPSGIPSPNCTLAPC